MAQVLNTGEALVSFGSPFIANAVPRRVQNNIALKAPDPRTFIQQTQTVALITRPQLLKNLPNKTQFKKNIKNKKTRQHHSKSKYVLCDQDTGSCLLADAPTIPQITAATASGSQSKPVHIIYFTDPICSSCWGIEPQLRKLKLKYGNYFTIGHRMGGLLPSKKDTLGKAVV